MVSFKGNIRKMQTTGTNPVEYKMVLLGKDLKNCCDVKLNDYLEKNIHINFTGNINCVACSRKIKKAFNQGHCYPCYTKLASCDTCIMRPQLCHFHKGTCREPEWGKANCFIPHIVYLANTSGLKVGITREGQIPTRWQDQGAASALPIFRVQSRYQSGLIEVELAKHMSDKTDWRKLLKSKAESINLEEVRDNILSEVASAIQAISSKFEFGDIEMLFKENVVDIEFPVLEYPSKISSHNLDKDPNVSGTLKGIKGQYLILDTGVINIRKFSGYEVEVKL